VGTDMTIEKGAVAFTGEPVAGGGMVEACDDIPELANTFRAGFDQTRIAPDLVSSHIQSAVPQAKTPGLKFERIDENTLRKAVANVEREIIAKALEKTQGNRTKAAKMLGLSTAGLIKKMDRCGLSVVTKVGPAKKRKKK